MSSVFACDVLFGDELTSSDEEIYEMLFLTYPYVSRLSTSNISIDPLSALEPPHPMVMLTVLPPIHPWH